MCVCVCLFYVENLFYYRIYIMFSFKYLYVKYFFNKHQFVFCNFHNISITYVHYFLCEFFSLQVGCIFIVYIEIQGVGLASLLQVRLEWCRIGKTRIGYPRLSQARLGQAKLVQDRLSYFRPCQARLVYARLGQARLRYNRLG